jgi:benzodiazapine receptor
MSNRWLSLAVFFALVLGGGLAIGYITAPGPWYAALEKPPFNPPNWLFGPVWAVLYVLIAIAGWRLYERGAGLPLKLWCVQLALNFSWSPVFFSAHLVGVALLLILALLASVSTFIFCAWTLDRPAALLFVPYAAWIAFAAVLNGAIFLLN